MLLQLGRLGRPAGPLACDRRVDARPSLWQGSSVTTRHPLACSGSLLWSSSPSCPGSLLRDGTEVQHAGPVWGASSPGGGRGSQGGGDQERGSGQREMGCCIFSLTSRRGRLTTQAAGRVLSVGPAMQVAGDVSPARRSRFSGQFSLCLLLRSSSHQVLTWLPCPEHKMPGAITNLKACKTA